MNNRFRNEKKGKILFMIPFIIGMVFLLVWVVQSLWNALLPEIIGVKAISYWQAFGILVLSKILLEDSDLKERERLVTVPTCDPNWSNSHPRIRKSLRKNGSNAFPEDGMIASLKNPIQ